MSEYYGMISRSSRRTMATACGTKATGLKVEAASWRGKITTRLWHDPDFDCDRYEVRQEPHHGHGIAVILAVGIIGQTIRKQ